MHDITQGHTVASDNEALAQLRGVVLSLGELVVGQVTKAVKALCEGRPDLARQVIEADRQVGEHDMEADEEVVRILALREPKAIDLRLVLGLSKCARELVSAGGKARKIARFALSLDRESERQPRRQLLRDVKLMNDRACCMLERSLDALARIDVPAAIGIAKEDDALDDEFDAAMRHLVTFMLEDPSEIARVLDMVFVLKSLERVGDHASHIAEQVVFVAEGRDIRYVSIDSLPGR
jgi:phosphate transport system protein